MIIMLHQEMAVVHHAQLRLTMHVMVVTHTMHTINVFIATTVKECIKLTQIVRQNE